MNKEVVKKAVEDCVNAMVRIDDEKSFINDVATRMKDDEGLEKAHFKKMVTLAYKQDAEDRKAELEQLINDLEELGY